MTDLISRQAAIDVLREYIVDNGMYDMDENVQGFNDGISCAISELSVIPSAQSEIIRCKDCAKRKYCRTSTVWAVAPDDDWYCADAERVTNGIQ